MSSADINAINQVLGNIQAQINLITGNTLSSYNQLSRIVAQQSNIYNTIYYGLGNLTTGNLTVNSDYTISGNLTYANVNYTGNLLLNNGNLILPNGNLISTIGNIAMSNGNIGITTGNLAMNNGNIGITNGNLVMSNGNIGMTQGNIVMSNGNIGMTQGNLIMSNGNIGMTRGNLVISNGNISMTRGNLIIGIGGIGVQNVSPDAILDIGGNVVIYGNVNVDNGTFWIDDINNRIGIRNTNPQYRLDVKGDANVTGSMISAGGFQFASTISNLTSPFTILTGTLSIGNIAANTTVGPFTITFGITFASAPIVTATARSGSNPESTCISVNPGTSTATVYCKNTNNSTNTTNNVIQWIAIGFI